FCSSEATTKCIGRAENGGAMRTATRSGSRTSACSSCSGPQPASTSPRPIGPPHRQAPGGPGGAGRPSLLDELPVRDLPQLPQALGVVGLQRSLPSLWRTGTKSTLGGTHGGPG